uniref:Neurensin 2 n=1 Tax=Falco tinnunculus TaxID=100819 RepID=A0A8C4TWJ2_FALTI
MQPAPVCGRGPSVAQGKWYGVHSYLHLFYEDCTGPGPPSSGSFFTGTLLLLVGAATLAAGSLVPPKLEGIMVEEFVVLDVQVVRYNHALGMCWLVGMVLCAVAGALAATGLLSCALAPRCPQEEEQQLSPILWGSPPATVPCRPVGTAMPFDTSCFYGIQPRPSTWGQGRDG